jgi:hypothetical protein
MISRPTTQAPAQIARLDTKCTRDVEQHRIPLHAAPADKVIRLNPAAHPHQNLTRRGQMTNDLSDRRGENGRCSIWGAMRHVCSPLRRRKHAKSHYSIGLLARKVCYNRGAS